jgi:hypothetical protein
MEELLQKIERRIRELVDQQHRLKYSSQQFNQDKSLLIHENELLMAQQEKEKEYLKAKQAKAISQIEALVARLKNIEKQL